LERREVKDQPCEGSSGEREERVSATAGKFRALSLSKTTNVLIPARCRRIKKDFPEEKGEVQ